jgi:hypothetical protein
VERIGKRATLEEALDECSSVPDVAPWILGIELSLASQGN